MVTYSAYLKSKSVGAKTITSPTFQLNYDPEVLSIFISNVVWSTSTV